VGTRCAAEPCTNQLPRILRLTAALDLRSPTLALPVLRRCKRTCTRLALVIHRLTRRRWHSTKVSEGWVSLSRCTLPRFRQSMQASTVRADKNHVPLPTAPPPQKTTFHGQGCIVLPVGSRISILVGVAGRGRGLISNVALQYWYTQRLCPPLTLAQPILDR
jgi:hypothetical protein